MSTENPWSAFQAGRTQLPMTGPGEEAYEQMLELADKIGSAYAEAYQKISAAFVEAFQKMAPQIGGLPDTQADRR